MSNICVISIKMTNTVSLILLVSLDFLKENIFKTDGIFYGILPYYV